MDFLDKVRQFSKRVESIKDSLTSEEATKTSLVLPFFQLLEYDVFNPIEFVPEYTADVGIKKGEKVDYAIIRDGKPVILIEVKAVTDDLTKHDTQLFRYFTATEAKFSILTNGLIYKFFTDLEESNKMDEKPFLEINILDWVENQISELKKFTKEKFDVRTIFNTASELKYTSMIKGVLKEQLSNPSDDFVRFIISDFCSGKKTCSVVEKFRPIVKKSMQQFVSDFMNEKLKIIMDNTQKEEEPDPINEEVDRSLTTSTSENKVVTTDEELKGYDIVRQILGEVVPEKSITYKDVMNYFGINYQNNIRKWICRLYFSPNRKAIAISNGSKKEVKHTLSCLNDLYKYKDELISAVNKYRPEVN